MCTDFFTDIKFPIVKRLGERVSELPALCRTTRPKGSSGLAVDSSHVRRGNAGTIVSTSSLDVPQDVLTGKRQCDTEMKLALIEIRKILKPTVTKIRMKLSLTLLLWRLDHKHVDSCVITDTRSRKLFARVHVHNTGHSDPLPQCLNDSETWMQIHAYEPVLLPENYVRCRAAVQRTCTQRRTFCGTVVLWKARKVSFFHLVHP